MRFVGFLLCAVVLAQETRPRLVKKVNVDFTEEARLARIDGSASLEMTIDEQGVPQSVRIVRPIGLGLDEEAIRAYSQWRFEPSSGRAPIAIQSKATFSAMESPIEWRLSRATFDTPSGASRPRVVSVEFPAPENQSVRAVVAISFDVDDDGAPANFHVESSSDPQWESAVIASAKKWRFQPATKNDSPIVVRASFEFVHGPKK